MRIVDAAQMRALDARTIDELGLPGMVLMERAALGVVDAIDELAASPARAVVLVGPGNNGGDGAAIARILHCRNIDVAMIVARSGGGSPDDAQTNLRISNQLSIPAVPADDPSVERLLVHADVVVDALLGVGCTSAPRGEVGALVDTVDALRQRIRGLVVAVDVPSGLDSDHGRCPGAVIDADLTVAIGLPKWGLLLPPGTDRAGDIVVADIGIPPTFVDGVGDALGLLVDTDVARSLWIAPPPSAHKGVHGHVAVVAGCDDTPGAAVLAADAALHAGAGLVTVVGTDLVRAAVVAHRPEIMAAPRSLLDGGVPDRFDAVVIGPGLGLDADAGSLLDRVLAGVGVRSTVIDADGLTLLSRRTGSDLPPSTVLTPHPGELGRLVGRTTDEVVADLRGAASDCAARFGATVVAKTAGAVIVDSGTAFVAPGHPGMATAGAGDVLSGVIAALAVRHGAPTGARLGAWVHAAAGRAAGEGVHPASLVAGDLVAHLADAFAELDE